MLTTQPAKKAASNRPPKAGSTSCRKCRKSGRAKADNYHSTSEQRTTSETEKRYGDSARIQVEASDAQRRQRRRPPPPRPKPLEPTEVGIAKVTQPTDDGVLIPSDVKPKDKERLEYIIELEKNLDEKNHYELLGVAKNASDKAIRTAFRLLARDYHVDRFTRYGLNRSTIEAVQRVFIAFNRAHETLSDAHLRQEYDIALQMQKSGKPVRASMNDTDSQLQDVLKAEKMTEVAISLLSRGQSAPAIEKLKQAIADSGGPLSSVRHGVRGVFRVALKRRLKSRRIKKPGNSHSDHSGK